MTTISKIMFVIMNKDNIISRVHKRYELRLLLLTRPFKHIYEIFLGDHKSKYNNILSVSVLV